MKGLHIVLGSNVLGGVLSCICLLHCFLSPSPAVGQDPVERSTEILELIAERPLAADEFSDMDLQLALGWRFGMKQPILELEPKAIASYRDAFERMGDPLFARRKEALLELGSMPRQPTLLIDWANDANDPEKLYRSREVLELWRRKLTDGPNPEAAKLEPVDVISKLPAGPFALKSMILMERENRSVSSDFYRKQIRFSSEGLSRAERLECLRLATLKREGPNEKYGYAVRNLFTHVMDVDEMRDPAWILEMATMNAKPNAVCDYRSIQWLEQAFRLAPEGMDLAPFKALLMNESNPNRTGLAASLARLGDEEAVEIFFNGLSENDTFRRYGHYVTRHLRPTDFPDPKAAGEAYAASFKVRMDDYAKRYKTSPEYAISQFSSNARYHMHEVAQIQDELVNYAKNTNTMFKIPAAILLRELGPEHRALLKKLDVENSPTSSYFELGNFMSALVEESLDPDKREHALEDLRLVLSMHMTILQKDMANCREKARPSASTLQTRIRNFCYSYMNLVLPAGIDAGLRDGLAELGSYHPTHHASFSEIAFPAAVAEARLTDTLPELEDNILSGTNLVDALQLLNMVNRNGDRTRKLLAAKSKELLGMTPLPQPVREALQFADPKTLYAQQIKFIGTVPGLCSVNLKRLGLDSMPAVWTEKLDDGTKELIAFCQNPKSAAPPTAPLPVDKEHLETLISLARQDMAPPGLVSNITSQLDTWLAEVHGQSKRPAEADMFRLALLGALTEYDFTPRSKHPMVRSYGWILEARRQAMLNDWPKADAAWQKAKPLFAATRSYSSYFSAWQDEMAIAQWMAERDRDVLLKDSKDRLKSNTYFTRAFSEFLLHSGRRAEAIDLASQFNATASVANSHLLFAFAALEEGMLEQAKRHFDVYKPGDYETIRLEKLLTQWMDDDPESLVKLLQLTEPIAATPSNAADISKLASRIKKPERRAYALWRLSGIHWRANDATKAKKVLREASELKNTLYGKFAGMELASRPAAEMKSMLTSDTLSDEPLTGTVSSRRLSRSGLTKRPEAGPELFQRVLFLDDRGIVTLDSSSVRTNTAWGLWLDNIGVAYRYRSGLRRVLAKGDGFTEAHRFVLEPWVPQP